MKKLSVFRATCYSGCILLGIGALGAGCSGQTEKAAATHPEVTVAGDTSHPAGTVTEPPTPPAPNTYVNNFIGEWKSIKSEGRNHMIIHRNGENFIIQEGKDLNPGVYDKNKKAIQVNVGAPLNIIYLEDEDMLLVSGAGKYRRISKK